MTVLRIDGSHAYLISRATPRLLAILGGIEGRRSWQQNGQSLKVEATQHNISLLLSLGDVEIEKASNDVIPEMEEFVNRKKYSEKTDSMPHQVRCREKMKDKKVFGVFAAPGTGKSKMLIDKIGELYCDGKITGSIVVSVKGAHRQFCDSQMPIHCGCEFSTATWPFDIDKVPKKGLQVVSFNYDSLRTAKGFKVAEEFAKKHKGKLALILDESHSVKNNKSERYKAVMELKPYSSHRYLATGTPMSVNIIDIWAQMNILDQNIIGIKYLTTFRSQFLLMGGFAGKQVLGVRDFDKFKSLVDPHTYSISKEDIGILPIMYDEWSIDLTREQKVAIREVKDNLELTIKEKIMDISTAAVAISKLQQIAGGFVITEEKKVHDIIPYKSNPRLIAAVDWVLAGDGAKSIIWGKFRHDLSLLAKALKDEGIQFVSHHGGTSDVDRKIAIADFLDPKGAQVLLANAATAGVGLNLQTGGASRALFYSNSFNFVEREQAEARLHRIGSFGAVVVTDLVARGSVDRHILSNLKMKKGQSELLLSSIDSAVGDM